jgi:hypothetical protein
MATLHIHLDESGNFTFSPKGSRFYIFTAAWTYNPGPLAASLNALRFRLIKEGHGGNLSGFHACADPPLRREQVVNIIRAEPEWNFASIVVEKNKVNPSLYAAENFYPKFLTMVLNFVLRGRVRPTTPLILIYTDTLPFSKPQAKAVEVVIKASCKAESKIPFHVLHHRIEGNYWIQVADYCSWSICRKWEFNDPTFYGQLRCKLAAPEIAPMSLGTGKTYY